MNKVLMESGTITGLVTTLTKSLKGSEDGATISTIAHAIATKLVSAGLKEEAAAAMAAQIAVAAFLAVVIILIAALAALSKAH